MPDTSGGLPRPPEEKLLEDDQVIWMDHLDLEWPNLRAAWEWLQARPVHRAHAVELLVGLRWHFWIRGGYAEAMQWYREAEALIEECDASDQARLFNGYAITLLHARVLKTPWSMLAVPPPARKSSDLAWEHAYALGVQAWLAVALGRPQDADNELPRGRANAAEHLNQPWIEGFTRLGLAFGPVYAQDHAQAVTAMREVDSIFDRAADRHMRMFATVQLALQQFLTGDSIAARGNTLRGLSFARQIANPRGLTGICETSAYIAAQEGHAPLAARLLGAAEAGRQMTGAPQFPYWMKLHDTAWDEICARIGQTAAEEAFAAGELAGPRACAPQAAAFLQSEAPSGCHATRTAPPDRTRVLLFATSLAHASVVKRNIGIGGVCARKIDICTSRVSSCESVATPAHPLDRCGVILRRWPRCDHIYNIRISPQFPGRVIIGSARHGAVQMVNVNHGHRRWQFQAVRCDPVDCRIVEPPQTGAAPVIAQPVRRGRVVTHLPCCVGLRRDLVQFGSKPRTKWRQRALARFDVTTPATRYHDDGFSMERGRDERRGRGDGRDGNHRQFIGRGLRKGSECTQHFGRALSLAPQPSSQNGRYGMQLEIELSNDSQPEASPAQRAKQVAVPFVTRPHYFAVGEHDFGGEQIITGQSVFSYQPADPAA